MVLQSLNGIVDIMNLSIGTVLLEFYVDMIPLLAVKGHVVEDVGVVFPGRNASILLGSAVVVVGSADTDDELVDAVAFFLSG